MLNPVLLAVALILTADEAADKAVKEAMATFRKEVRNPAAPQRAIAVAKLAKTPHKKTLGLLGSILFGKEDPAVKSAAAKGLGGFAGLKPYAIHYLTKGLAANKKDGAVRAAIYAALGKLGDAAALPTILKGFQDTDATAAGAATLAAGNVKDKRSILGLIENLKRLESIKPAAGGGGGGFRIKGIPGAAKNKGKGKNAPRTIKALTSKSIESLQKLTGEKWGSSAEWQIWLKRRGKNFKFE